MPLYLNCLTCLMLWFVFMCLLDFVFILCAALLQLVKVKLFFLPTIHNDAKYIVCWSLQYIWTFSGGQQCCGHQDMACHTRYWWHAQKEVASDVQGSHSWNVGISWLQVEYLCYWMTLFVKYEFIVLCVCYLYMCTHINLSVKLYSVKCFTNTINFLGTVAMKEFYMLWVIWTCLEDLQSLVFMYAMSSDCEICLWLFCYKIPISL